MTGYPGVAHNMYTHMCIKLSENYFFSSLCVVVLENWVHAADGAHSGDSHNMRIIMSRLWPGLLKLKLQNSFEICTRPFYIKHSSVGAKNKIETFSPHFFLLLMELSRSHFTFFSTLPAVITIFTSIKCFIQASASSGMSCPCFLDLILFLFRYRAIIFCSLSLVWLELSWVELRV